MSIFSNDLQVATEKHCTGWGGNEAKGKWFRCYFCGHKFEPGDKFRAQYTNDTEAYGNPLVCEKCDEGPEKTREKWKALRAEFMVDKFWWFRFRKVCKNEEMEWTRHG